MYIFDKTYTDTLIICIIMAWRVIRRETHLWNHEYITWTDIVYWYWLVKKKYTSIMYGCVLYRSESQFWWSVFGQTYKYSVLCFTLVGFCASLLVKEKSKNKFYGFCKPIPSKEINPKLLIFCRSFKFETTKKNLLYFSFCGCVLCIKFCIDNQIFSRQKIQIK